MPPTPFARNASRLLHAFAPVTLLLCAALLGIGARPAAPAIAFTVTSHALTLSTPLKAVACVDTSTCFAVGAGGIVSHTTNGGTSWDLRATGTAATLNGIACPTTAVCFAAGAGGTIQNTSDGGSTWATQASNTTQDLNAVACVSATSCYAVGAGGTIVATANGVGWSAQASGTTANLLGVSCASSSLCVAVGAGGTILATTNGSTWTSETSNTTAQLNGVSCVHFSTTCFAAGGGSTFVKTTDGASWTAGSILQTAFSFNAVSCAAAATCVAVGQAGFIFGTSDGATWTSEHSGTSQSLSGVACPSSVACFVTGAGDSILATVNSGASWTAQTASYSGAIAGVACPSTSVCFAVGGIIGGTADGGASWSLLGTTRGAPLSAIACPSTAACTAVGAGGQIVSTADGGASWSLQTPFTNSLAGVACPTATACYAVGAGGTIESNASGTWASVTSSTSQSLTSVACTGTATCVAVGVSGTIVRTTNGTQWSAVSSGTSADLLAVACAPGGLCLASGGGVLLRSFDAGASWSTGAAAPAGSGSNITCPASTVCVTASGGAIASSGDAGASWSAQTIGGGEGLLSIACPALSLCAIGTNGGHVYMASSQATAISLAVSPNPPVSGQPATFTATLSACTPAPTGNVAFFDGLSLLGSATISGGQAQLTNVSLAAGSHQLTASYGGDANCSGAVSNAVNVGSAPATPAPTSPASGATGQSTTPTLSWTSSAGATSYSVAISDVTASQTLTTLTSTSTSLAVPASEGLVSGHQYAWTVAACNAVGCSAPSTASTFTTGLTPGTVPLVSPVEGAQNVALTPTLSWNAPGGATQGTTQYTAYVWDPQASVMKFQQATTALSVAVPASAGLQPGVFYYWSVQACNGSACGPLARWIGFTTTAGPGSPVLVSPTEGSTTVSTTPTLQWTAAGGATASTQYTAYIWDPTPGSVVFQQTTTRLSVTVPAGSALQAGHFYYYSAQACNGSACGPLARWEGFTTASGLGAPGLTSPAEGATGVALTPTLQWTAANGTNASTQYTAYIWDPAAGRTVFQQSTNGLSVSVPQSAALQSNHFYYYSAQACNGSTCGPLARWEGFTTGAGNAPGVVTLNLPAEGAQDVSLTPVLGWSAPSGAIPGTTQYTAYVWDPAASAMRFQATGTGLSVAVPGSAGLVLGHFYYWSVQACNGGACGPLARWEGFTTVSSIGAPALRSPAEGATGVGVTPTIAWLAPSGASPGNTVYTVYVWDPSASIMKFQQTTTALSIAVPFSSGLVSGHFYYYSVQACNGSTCGPLARWEGFTS